MESDLNLIQECGFDSFEEIVDRINELVDIMRVGRTKAEKNLERFNEEAKNFLRKGDKDNAKKVLAVKKKKFEKLKTFDNQLNAILEKMKGVKNSNQMVQVLNATKYCNGLLLMELSEDETGESTEENKEYQDLLENDIEITEYLDTIIKAKKSGKNKSNINQINQINNDNNINIEQDDDDISDGEAPPPQLCELNQFEEDIKKINGFVDNIRLGRNLAEKSLEKHIEIAKNFLRKSQKDECKKELKKKKIKEEKIKNTDNLLISINGKISQIKSNKQIIEILNDVKSCNKLIMDGLSQNEEDSEIEGTKEFQGLIENEIEINKYLKRFNSSGNNIQQQQNNNKNFNPYDSIKFADQY